MNARKQTSHGRQAGDMRCCVEARQVGREGGREGRREGRRDGRTEGGRDGGTEGGRQGGREAGREGRREGGRESGGKRERQPQAQEDAWMAAHLWYARFEESEGQISRKRRAVLPVSETEG